MPLTFLASTTPSLWIFYWLIFNALVTVAGAESVGAADSQLSYLGTWVDQDNGGHKFTGEKGASVSLSFKGTAISWYSDIDVRGAVGVVTVDGGSSISVDLAAQASQDQTTTISALQFSKEGLDGSKQHTIKITYGGTGKYGGPYLAFYRFEVTPPDPNAPTTTTSSPAPVQTTQQSTITTIITQAPATSTITTNDGESTIMTTQVTTVSQTVTSTEQSPDTSSTTATSPLPDSSASPSVSETTYISHVPTTFSINGQAQTTTVVATYVSTASPQGAAAAETTTTVAPATTTTAVASASGSNIAMIAGIVGGVCGGLLAAVLLFLLLVCLRRRRRGRKRRQERMSRPFFMLQPSSRSVNTDISVDDKYELQPSTPSSSSAIMSPAGVSSPLSPASEGPASTIMSYMPLLQPPDRRQASGGSLALPSVLETDMARSQLHSAAAISIEMGRRWVGGSDSQPFSAGMSSLAVPGAAPSPVAIAMSPKAVGVVVPEVRSPDGPYAPLASSGTVNPSVYGEESSPRSPWSDVRSSSYTDAPPIYTERPT